jgi:hypothetical protein
MSGKAEQNARKLKTRPTVGDEQLLREVLERVRDKLVAVCEQQAEKRGDYLYRGQPDKALADAVNEIDAALGRRPLVEGE